MRVLLIGSGGREHALAYKLAQSPLCEALFATRPNAGMADLAVSVDLDVSDVSGLLAFATEARIDLTVVGPELPLTLGVVDAFRAGGLAIWGPTRAAARLEGSKAYAKELMARAGIPTAEWGSFTELDAAVAWVERFGRPVVVKADGLAAGKGVVLCEDLAEAKAALHSMMAEGAFGGAGSRVVVEELLVGEEVSFIALCDGTTILPLASSQDHKRIGEGDTGPNTGGMGAYSPSPLLNVTREMELVERVMAPVVGAMAAEGHVFTGFLYAGLMMTETGPKVLEYNVRLGDPETQPLLVRLESDLLAVLVAGTQGELSGITLRWDPRPAMCVVLAAAGYPTGATKGDRILGLQAAASTEDTYLFHAGTKRVNDACVVNGGRVLSLTSLGETLQEARDKVYAAVDEVSWPGMQVRRDIGHRALP